MDIEKLYEQLSVSGEDDFYNIEAQFCTELHYGVSAEKRQACVVTFLTIANWTATSLRSGVWTFYEACDPTDLNRTLEYLRQSKEEEFAKIFALGIHEYQDPKYAENFDYPQEWIEESEQIDAWILKNEAWLINWKRKLLLDNWDTFYSC